MHIKQLSDISELIVGVSLLQTERAFSIKNYGQYLEGEQTLANITTGFTGVLALGAAFKALNFATSYLKAFVSISLPLCILPSAIFHCLDYLEMKDNKYYKVIKFIHTYLDQVASLAMLVSQVAFLYLGAPLFGVVSIGIVTTVIGFACSSISVYSQLAKQQRDGSYVRPSSSILYRNS